MSIEIYANRLLFSFWNILQVLKDMREYKILITVYTYIAIFRHCFRYADVKNAIVTMKKYIKDYKDLPLLRHLVMLFFSIIARYDFGMYKLEARAWLNSIVPKKREDDMWLPSSRSHYSPLQEQENTFLSPMQSTMITQYIQQMDYSQIVAPAEHKQPISSLFTGSEIDIEDILVHEYGYDEKAVREAMGEDPTYLSLKQQIDEVNASFEARKQQIAIEKGEENSKKDEK